MLKINCVRKDLKVRVRNMKIKTLYVDFFKCSFIKRVRAVTFELHEGTKYSLVKIKLQSTSSKIGQGFGKINIKRSK